MSWLQRPVLAESQLHDVAGFVILASPLVMCCVALGKVSSFGVLSFAICTTCRLDRIRLAVIVPVAPGIHFRGRASPQTLWEVIYKWTLFSLPQLLPALWSPFSFSIFLPRYPILKLPGTGIICIFQICSCSGYFVPVLPSVFGHSLCLENSYSSFHTLNILSDCISLPGTAKRA